MGLIPKIRKLKKEEKMEELVKTLGMELMDFSELNDAIAFITAKLPEGCYGAVGCKPDIEAGCSVSCD